MADRYQMNTRKTIEDALAMEMIVDSPSAARKLIDGWNLWAATVPAAFLAILIQRGPEDGPVWVAFLDKGSFLLVAFAALLAVNAVRLASRVYLDVAKKTSRDLDQVAAYEILADRPIERTDDLPPISLRKSHELVRDWESIFYERSRIGYYLCLGAGLVGQTLVYLAQ